MTMYTNNELYHHGILGQKWGIRRFQNTDGTLTSAGKKRLSIGSGLKKAGTVLLDATKNRLQVGSKYKEKIGRFKNYDNFEKAEHKAYRGKSVAGVRNAATALNPFASKKSKEDAKANYAQKSKEYEEARKNTNKAWNKLGKDKAEYLTRDTLKKAARDAVTLAVMYKGMQMYNRFAANPQSYINEAAGIMKGLGSKAADIYNKMYDTSILDEGGKVIRRYASKKSPIRDVTNTIKR